MNPYLKTDIRETLWVHNSVISVGYTDEEIAEIFPEGPSQWAVQFGISCKADSDNFLDFTRLDPKVPATRPTDAELKEYRCALEKSTDSYSYHLPYSERVDDIMVEINRGHPKEKWESRRKVVGQSIAYVFGRQISDKELREMICVRSVYPTHTEWTVDGMWVAEEHEENRWKVAGPNPANPPAPSSAEAEHNAVPSS